jgi:Zinc knuckle
VLGGGEKRSLTDIPYATCFVCGEKGHLASQCQQNEQGIYVNGGCCRTCGSTKHFAVDCPKTKESNLLRTKEEPTEEEVALANQVFLEGHGDEQPERKNQAPKVHKKRRVVKF